jgi:hypothetical protein
MWDGQDECKDINVQRATVQRNADANPDDLRIGIDRLIYSTTRDITLLPI